LHNWHSRLSDRSYFTLMRFNPRFSAVLRIFFVDGRLRLSYGRFTLWLPSTRFLHGSRYCCGFLYRTAENSSM